MISNGAQFALNHHQGLFTNYIYRVGKNNAPPNGIRLGAFFGLFLEYF